jgi:hypothetical protein
MRDGAPLFAPPRPGGEGAPKAGGKPRGASSSKKDASLTAWEDAASLLGTWTLDESASDSQEALFDLFELSWARRTALSYVTQARIRSRMHVHLQPHSNTQHAPGVQCCAALTQRRPRAGGD